MKTDYSSIRTPFERLSNIFKNTTRAIEKEIASIVSLIHSLKQSNSSPQFVRKTLNSAIEKIRKLQSKIEEIHKQETALLEKIRVRINNTMEYETAEKESDSVKLLLWKQHQLNRMVLDYLVRDEKYELALAFAEDLHLSDYSDLDLHVTRSQHIVDSLKKHDCTDALKWINLNRSKLVKANCLEYEKLEMELKIQEFIHLVSENQTVEAVRYSQTYLLPYAVNNDENMNRIKQAMGAIVFIHHDDSYIYKEFMGDERWINIIDLFKLVFNKLYKIPAESILSIYMKLGLSTLKSSCLAGVKNTDCPTCRTDVQNITRSLPALIHSHSTLLCPLSKKPMNDMNYPMVLPNGNVYAKDSIEDLKTEDKLTIVDPKTNNVFKVSEIRRVYIT